jgi:hypothetical protein
MPGRQLRPVNKKSPAEAGLKVCHAKRDEEGPRPAEVYWIKDLDAPSTRPPTHGAVFCSIARSAAPAVFGGVARKSPD